MAFLSSKNTNKFNPLLHRLFLDHDIIFFIFRQHQKKSKKNLSKVLNTFENNFSKYLVFQRHQKALSWSKGLING